MAAEAGVREVEVGGLLLDAALLVDSPAVERLLFRLRFSKLVLGALFTPKQPPLTPEKEALLKKWGIWEVMRVVVSDEKNDSEEAIKHAWPLPATSSVFVMAHQDDALECKLAKQGWSIVQPVAGDSRGKSSISATAITIEQLEDIFAALATLNKKAMGDELVVIGHTMKWSREKDFLKRGALPLVPTQSGLSFIPILLDRPLEQQLAVMDIILHKATDEIVSISEASTGSVADRITFSDGIQRLERYVAEHPQLCVVDPISRVMPLLDRGATRAILEDLGAAAISEHTIVRPPRSVEVASLEEPQLSQLVAEAQVGLPTIVKPLMACGASEAHTMAVVFKKEGYEGLQVPVPAVIQEYIDHGSCVYKFYVVGSKVMYSCRKSMPNAAALAVSTAASNSGLPALIFDSLKPLPGSFTTDKNKAAEQEVVEEAGNLDLEAVKEAATWLRGKLGLTIIGFDIVVQVGTKDHVMVDVNYFPSFKDVPDTEAIPAFWEALVNAHRLKSSTTL